MRFLLVDRVFEWSAHERMTGVKNITMSEDFFEHHFPRYPVMPGVMMLESLAQLAGWLEAASTDFENWLLLDGVVQSKFYGLALPGDQLHLEVTAKPCDEPGEKLFRGVGKIEKKRCIVTGFRCRAVPMLDIESPEEQRLLFNVLTREVTRLASGKRRRMQ